MIVFDENDTEGLDCYKNSVAALKWDSECAYGPDTEIYLNQESFSSNFVSLDQIDFANKKVIIDNTPLPAGGAFSDMSVTTMTTVRTEYTMTYNIKTLTIYAGLGCLILFSIILGQCYLIGKLRKDTNSKRDKLRGDFGDNSGYSLAGMGEIDLDKDR